VFILRRAEPETSLKLEGRNARALLANLSAKGRRRRERLVALRLGVVKATRSVRHLGQLPRDVRELGSQVTGVRLRSCGRGGLLRLNLFELGGER